MALVGPTPLVDSNPLAVVLRDLRDERSASVGFPPGETRFSLARTRRFAEDPLPMLLEGYERFGPVFTLRLLHGNVVFMLGPAANHYITVSHASNFLWRDGHFRDLIGLMGDGLLTIDGEFHRRSRLIMLPAFHHEHLTASVETIVAETAHALDEFSVGEEIDLYAWTRRLALRVAMRALFGLDPDSERARAIDAAGLFEQALSFYSSDYLLRILRTPYTPWARMQQAARKLDTLIYSEIARRRDSGERGHDILSLLLDAQDEDGNTLSDLQIRDEVMTLLFAGHDTTTSTVSFMFYELARNPAIVARLIEEQDAQLRTASPRPPSSPPVSSPSSSACSMRPCASTRPPGSAPGARSSRSSSKVTRCPAARSSTTAHGRAITCPTSFPNRRRSVPSDSRARVARHFPREPTSPSGAARARASACASASSRSVRSPRSYSPGSRSRFPATSSSRYARCRRSARRTVCR